MITIQYTRKQGELCSEKGIHEFLHKSFFILAVCHLY